MDRDNFKKQLVQAYIINQEKGLKHVEGALQDAIESNYPGKSWWEVCNVSIFDLLFFERMEPMTLIDAIIENCKEV